MEINDQLKKCIDLVFSLPPFSFYGGDALKNVTKSIYMWINYSCFSLNSAQVANLIGQRNIVQLFFDTIPNGILKILVINNIINCPGFIEDKSSAASLYLALLSTFVKVIQMYVNLRIESSSLEEDPATYIAEVFNAKITWIPFIKKMPNDVDNQIEDEDYAARAFNFSQMTVSFGWITNKFGFTNTIKYAFSDSSLQTLAIYMQKQKSSTGEMADDFVLIQKSDAVKQHIILDKASTESISINTFMYFYENLCRTKFDLDLIDVDFPHLVQNAKDFGLIIKDKNTTSKDGNIVSPYRCLTMAGTPCIQICIDSEKDN